MSNKKCIFVRKKEQKSNEINLKLMKQKLLLFLSVLLTTAGAWAQTAYDGVYTMQVDENQKRGYVAAGEGYADYPILSDITWNDYKNNSTPAIENGKNWYITSTNAGESY
jgi:hypothetical protein